MDESEALLGKAAEGKVSRAERLAAFGRIVRRYQDMAYGCAYAILGDFHLAEDAAQEAFLTAYLELPKLREAQAFGGWLRRIVVSRCSRMSRRKQVVTGRLDAAAGVPSGQPAPPQVMERREMTEKVAAAVRALPSPERMVTTLFYINGYSQKDIAEFLEVPVTTVKKRLATSRTRLKQRMIAMVDEVLKSHALPGDFADVVVRKAATDDDLAEAAKLLGYSSRKQPKDFTSTGAADQEGVYIVGKAGVVEGAGYFTCTEFAIGSTVLPAARPREMGAESAGVPDPRFVRSFRACFKLAREQGIGIAAVHGSQFDHGFCGFVPCFYYPVATLSCAAALSVDSRAELLEADERQVEAARQAWLTDPHAPKVSGYIGGGRPHVVVQDGGVCGYVRINPDFDAGKGYGMPFGYVTDVTVQTRDAALAVLRRHAELASAAGDDTVCQMQSHQTRITQTMLELGGTYLLRGSCDLVGLDAEMVAIVDLAALTEQIADEFRSRIEASGAGRTDAGLSIEMCGQTVGFVVRSGRLEIVNRKQKVHRVLPRWVVTRLYVGYYSGEDLLTMGPIPDDRSDGHRPDNPDFDMHRLELPDAQAGLFRTLFPKTWPVSWPDPDVWPWVIGQTHPRYQHEDGKTPEMKAAIDSLRFPWLGR